MLYDRVPETYESGSTELISSVTQKICPNIKDAIESSDVLMRLDYIGFNIF